MKHWIIEDNFIHLIRKPEACVEQEVFKDLKKFDRTFDEFIFFFNEVMIEMFADDDKPVELLREEEVQELWELYETLAN